MSESRMTSVIYRVTELFSLNEKKIIAEDARKGTRGAILNSSISVGMTGLWGTPRLFTLTLALSHRGRGDTAASGPSGFRLSSE